MERYLFLDIDGVLNTMRYSDYLTEHDKDALFLQLKEYLIRNGYYVGNSWVAKVLRRLADYWDD